MNPSLLLQFKKIKGTLLLLCICVMYFNEPVYNVTLQMAVKRTDELKSQYLRDYLDFMLHRKVIVSFYLIKLMN